MGEPVRVEGVKLCTGCNSTKPVEAFYRSNTKRDGRQSRCKACQLAYSYRWRAANPEKAYNLGRRWYVNGGADRQRTRLYGITPGEYEAMREAQEDLCAVCRVVNERRALDVDHCHATGKVRGLLCFKCNTAIGKFDDSPERLRAAAEYLERAARDEPTT